MQVNARNFGIGLVVLITAAAIGLVLLFVLGGKYVLVKASHSDWRIGRSEGTVTTDGGMSYRIFFTEPGFAARVEMDTDRDAGFDMRGDGWREGGMPFRCRRKQSGIWTEVAPKECVEAWMTVLNYDMTRNPHQ